MLDFTSAPVVDNHSHPFELDKIKMDAEWLARNFFHGIGDIPTAGVKKARFWGATDDLRFHFLHMGVVQTMVCLLSKLLNCPAELEAVAAERGRRVAADFAGYVKLLYEDAGIVASVLDTGLPKDDPALALLPGRVLRLFQMEPALDRLLEESSSYAELLRGFQGVLARAVREDGAIGVKCHLAEQVGLGVLPVSAPEAEAAFAAAKKKDDAAYKKLYVAIFTATLLQCQELKVPLHLHTGCSGGLWNGPIANADPFLLAPFIRQPQFLTTRIVLLHAGYPWVQHAAEMAHAFPHVWVDMSWTTPWVSLRLAECYREVIGIAPLSKIMVGSGGHVSPEIAWLAARVAKIALGEVLADAVRMSLMDPKQAELSGRMILHDNAARMYGLKKG